MFLGKCVLKTCSKFTGEHPRRSAISIKLQSNFVKITLRHGCSPVNLLQVFRTPFLKNTSEGLLLLSDDIKWLPSPISFNPFYANVPFLYPLKTRHENGTLAWKGLKKHYSTSSRSPKIPFLQFMTITTLTYSLPLD